MEKHSMYGSKIRLIRLMRGLTQENMADKLDIKQNVYSKIETDQKKVSHEELQAIAQILDVSISDITSPEPIIINNNSSTIGAQGHIEHFYNDQKELYLKIIEGKDKEIERLAKQLESLMKLMEKLK